MLQEKGHFNHFEKKRRSLDPQHPPLSCAPSLRFVPMQVNCNSILVITTNGATEWLVVHMSILLGGFSSLECFPKSRQKQYLRSNLTEI